MVVWTGKKGVRKGSGYGGETMIADRFIIMLVSMYRPMYTCGLCPFVLLFFRAFLRFFVRSFFHFFNGSFVASFILSFDHSFYVEDSYI